MAQNHPFWRGSALTRRLAAASAPVTLGVFLAVTGAAAPNASAQSVAIKPAAPLSVDDAVARAIAVNPSLRAAAAGIDAAQGDLKQARARPNPEFSAEVENFNGRGDQRAFNSAETTFSLSQQLDLLGQRRARMRLAERQVHGAELDSLIRGLDLIRDVQTAYFDALATQSFVDIATERFETARALRDSVDRRVKAARDPLMAGARAEAGLAEARIALNAAKIDFVNARARLATMIGDDGFTLDSRTFALASAPAHPHAPPTDQTPDLARLATTRDQASAALRVEKSLSWQNPTLSLGYRQFQERRGDGAMVAGFSMPFGVFNRNQGGIARASADQRRADFELEAGRRNLLREFAELQRAIAIGANSVRATETDVIPQAERALTLATDGYDRGAFSYLDVLEAQRSLSDARERRIESLRTFHANEAALDRLTARFAEALAAEETHP